MNPIGVAVFAALLLSIERSNSQTGFSYDRQDLWNLPTAMRLTPIDIITRDIQRNSSLMELEFNDVWTATLDGTFSNNGLTPRFVASTGGTATVRNHLGSYDLLNFHLHWGRENDQGTGHRINGEEFGLEFHFVTLLQGEGLVNLGNTSRGDLISVISVLAEVDDIAEISGVWEKLNISAIIGAGNSTAVTGLSYPSVLPENIGTTTTIQVLKRVHLAVNLYSGSCCRTGSKCQDLSWNNCEQFGTLMMSLLHLTTEMPSLSMAVLYPFFPPQ